MPRLGAKKEEKPEEIYDVLGSGVVVEHPWLHDLDMRISWKLSMDSDMGPVDFEWTWRPDQGKVW